MAKDPLAEEADARLKDCRRHKFQVEADLREALCVTRPRLSRQILSETLPLPQPRDAAELATAIGTEVNEDFATEVINAFMPPNVPWAASEPGEGVPDDLWASVKDEAFANDIAIFRAIRASNFDAELATSLIPNAGIGTHAMWVDDRQAHEPVLCMDVPLRELEINVGPYGGVGDRFIVRHVLWRNVKAVLPAIKLPADLAKMVTEKPDEWAECRWGFWRDWTVETETVWVWVIQIADTIVDKGNYKGAGSCPLIVGRFSPDSMYAFGNGPTLDSLPYLRMHNRLAEETLDNAELAIQPPIAYPDDGVMNFDQGIQAGMAYPKRPGSKGEIESLNPPSNANPNLGLFTIEQIEKTIRRKHFADYPEQPGKTPPSATQWLDEMVKSQRRIGTPGVKYWAEFPAEVFIRFKYLMEKRGVIKQLTNSGKAISTRPRNPATKSQAHQELQESVQMAGLAKQIFPVTSQAAIDEAATLKNWLDKSGDKLIVLRDPKKVESIVAGILQGAGSALGGAGGGAGAAPPGEAGASPTGGPAPNAGLAPSPAPVRLARGTGNYR